MMRLNKLVIVSILASIFFISCKKDSPNTPMVVIRDKSEVKVENDDAIMAFLNTHFYNAEDFINPPEGFNYELQFDTIAGSNSNKTPISDSNLLSTKTITKDSLDYTIYILKIREGVGQHPTFADSTFQNYKGELLDQSLFDHTTTPVWFDHPGTRNASNPGIAVVALTEALTQFGEASGFTLNADNTVAFNNDFGVGAVFLPSGLGYFSMFQASIPSYSPLIFSFQLYRVNQADHDHDGIPSYMEDLNGNRIVGDDDSDGDQIPDYLDADDDNDGTLTKNEITINLDGSIDFTDKNGDGIPDYLDPETYL